MKRGLIVLSLLLLTGSCQKESYSRFSTKHKVFFGCNISVYPYNGIVTPGRFMTVRKSEGVLVIVDSDGKDFREPLTANDNATFIMGLSGLILGTPIFNNDGFTVWAYDLGCPECDAPTVRLKVDLQEGSASCSKCGGSWNLNVDGNPVNDDGVERRPLYRYPTSLSGNLLTVSN